MMRCFIYLMFLVITLKAGTNKPYSIESGKILYEIYGGGVFTSEVNLSIEGKEEFLFRGWGQEHMDVMEYTERLVGILQSTEKIISLKKRKGKKLYNVNFEDESIIQSKFVDNKEQIDLSQMQHEGSMEIAAQMCEVWKGKNRTVCLSKGIILLDEKNYLGFTYGKKAVKVDHNTTFSEEDFTLPAFPVKKDLLLRDKVKTTQTYKKKTLSERIINAKEDIAIDDRRYNKALDTFSKKLFKRKKEDLIVSLDTMSKTRVCLHRAESSDDANLCMNNDINADDESYKMLFAWDEESKEKIFDEFDDKIGKLDARLPCINRALNISDLAECMK